MDLFSASTIKKHEDEEIDLAIRSLMDAIFFSCVGVGDTYEHWFGLTHKPMKSYVNKWKRMMLLSGTRTSPLRQRVNLFEGKTSEKYVRAAIGQYAARRL